MLMPLNGEIPILFTTEFGANPLVSDVTMKLTQRRLTVAFKMAV